MSVDLAPDVWNEIQRQIVAGGYASQPLTTPSNPRAEQAWNVPFSSPKLLKTLMKLIICFTIVFLCTPFCSSALAFEYRIVDLGPGIGWDINESGQVIAGGPGNNIQSYVWSDGARTLLPLQYSLAFGGINDAGVAVGSVTTPGGIAHAITWLNGFAQDLGTFDGDESRAFAINNAGHVVGTSALTGGTTSDDYRAFLFDGNAMMELGSLPGGMRSEAKDINDLGQIVGETQISTVLNGDQRGFLYSNGVMTDIGTFGGSTFANAINNLGHVVGYSASGALVHAYLYDGTQMHDLGTGVGNRSGAHDINDLGQVVGFVGGNTEGVSGAMVWDATRGMRRLYDLIDPMSGWGSLSIAYGINNRGQIVGAGQRGSVEHAFLLTPVPEPSSLALLGLAIAGLIGYGFKRPRRD